MIEYTPLSDDANEIRNAESINNKLNTFTTFAYLPFIILISAIVILTGCSFDVINRMNNSFIIPVVYTMIPILIRDKLWPSTFNKIMLLFTIFIYSISSWNYVNTIKAIDEYNNEVRKYFL